MVSSLLHYVDPSTGKEFAFEWKAPINIRTGVGTNDGHRAGCPYLAPNPKVWTGFNDLATWYPEIAAEFHPAKNRKKTAADVYKCTPVHQRSFGGSAHGVDRNGIVRLRIGCIKARYVPNAGNG